MKSKISDIAQANYEHGVLTLDLPRALQPMLWRQEIKNISNVVFWLAPQDNGEHALMLRLANGTEQTIARFNNEVVAEQSLGAIRTIFMNGKVKRNFWGKILRVILIILCIWIFGSLAFQLAAGLALKENPSARALMNSVPSPSMTAQTPPVPGTATPIEHQNGN